MRIESLNNLTLAKEIYKLNNSKYVRGNSKNKTQFTYKEHLKWMKKNIISKNINSFTLTDNKVFIGIISSKKKGSKFFLSWSVKRIFRNKGYGKKMLKFVNSKFPKNYFAKIKTKNIYSLKMCLGCGFKIYYKNKDYYFLKNN